VVLVIGSNSPNTGGLFSHRNWEVKQGYTTPQACRGGGRGPRVPLRREHPAHIYVSIRPGPQHEMVPRAVSS
jgi:hypothetical protein